MSTATHEGKVLHPDDECPNCMSGTLEDQGAHLACRGECGALFATDMKVMTAKELGEALLRMPHADHRVVVVSIADGEPYTHVTGVVAEPTGSPNPPEDGLIVLQVEPPAEASKDPTAWIKAKYEPEIRRILTEIGDACRHYGMYAGEPDDFSADEYAWAMIVNPDSCHLDNITDVQIVIEESAAYGDEPGGVNFKLEVTGSGGRIIIAFAPYNYTEQVWVPAGDAAQVAERFRRDDRCQRRRK